MSKLSPTAAEPIPAAPMRDAPVPGNPPPLTHRRKLTSSGALADRIVAIILAGCAILVVLIVLGILAELVYDSRQSLTRFGWGFITSTAWNPVPGVMRFGALSSIYGTLITSAIAMLIAVPMSLAISLFLVELAPKKIAGPVGGAIELLAAVPSIIFGMWGLMVFAPWMAGHVEPALQAITGWIPLVNLIFAGPTRGIGILTASLILALMVLPFMTAIARDVMRMTPSVLRESAYGMGSTTWEVTRKVTVPYGLRGLVGAGFLALSRALGETMAVTFVIGNDHRITPSLIDAGNTISSTLANEFTEAVGPIYLSSLIELALILFIITIIVQVLAYGWLAWMQRGQKGARR